MKGVFISLEFGLARITVPILENYAIVPFKRPHPMMIELKFDDEKRGMIL